MNTHANVIYKLSDKHPVEYELKVRSQKFIFLCIDSDNFVVRYIARHLVFVSRCLSLLGRNFWNCYQELKLFTAIPDYNCNLDYKTTIWTLRKR